MTRFKRKYFLVCLLLLFFPGAKAIAQHRPDTLSVGMYPPEAASLMTYTDYPVSYITGTPDISIPLYTIKSGTLELPLTLKFHMGDYLRANQAAGVIGAGWSLSTDFLVTRKIKGLDDLSTYGYLHTGHLLTEQEDLMNVTWKMAQEIIDGEPDRYYFRTLDGNGNFYVLENGSRIEQVPSGPEKIEFTTGNPPIYEDRFTITDEKGRVYRYAGENVAADKTEMADDHWTAWHCREISDDTGSDKLIFSYIEDHPRTILSVPQGITVCDSLPVLPLYVPLFDLPRLDTGAHDYPFFLFLNQETGIGYKWYADSTRFSKSPYPDPSAIDSHLVNRIDFRGGYLSFSYSTHYKFTLEAGNIAPFSVLDSIRVHTSTGTVIHTYSFVHNTDITDVYNVYLTEIIVDGTIHYTFANPSISRGSGSADFWGYDLYDEHRRPNAIDSPIHIAHGEIRMHYGDTTILWGEYLPSFFVDNITSPIYKTGNGDISFEIRYPTGGRSVFRYEYDSFFDDYSQGYKHISSRRIKSICVYDTDGTLLEEKIYSYDNGRIIHRPSGQSSTGPKNTILSQQIDVHATSPTVVESIFYDYPITVMGIKLGSYRKRFFLAGTVFNDEFTTGNWIYYPSVSETIMQRSSPIGRTVYSYDIEGPAGSPGILTYSTETAPYPIDKHYWYTGTLKQISKYSYQSGMYNLLEKTEYSWQTYLKNRSILVAKIWPYVQAIDYNADPGTDNRLYNLSEYTYTTQHLDLGHNRLLREKKTEWLDDGTSLVTTKEYKYDNPDSLTVGRIITHFPDNTIQTEIFVHENDYSPLTDIEERPTYLTEYVRLLNGVVAEGWAYNRYGSRIYNVYTLDTNNLPSSSFKLSSRSVAGVFDNTGTPTSEMILDSHYSVFDSYQYDATYGTISRISRRGELPKAFMWGYGGLYPVWMAQGDMNTTATYSPLVGMTSMTRPDGITSNYTYNQYGRLTKTQTDGQTITEYYYSFDNSTGPGDQWIRTRSHIDNNLGINLDEITWYNGLGLPDQTVTSLAPNKDIIQQIQYDGMLRDDARVPLPYATSNTAHRNNRLSTTEEQNQYYSTLYGSVEAEQAYSGKTYELSPLGRLRAEWEPGTMGLSSSNIDAKKTTYSYVSNATGEVRRMYCLPNGGLVTVNDHPAGTLRCVVKTDPDGHTLRTYSDGLGRLVLERRNDGSANIDTYYAYDPMGRLRWVVSPQGVDAVISEQQLSYSGNLARQYCYYYEYDSRGNITLKQIPGADPVSYTYDDAGRVLTMIDGNLAAVVDTLVYTYDGYGREIKREIAGNNAGTIHMKTYDYYTPDLAASPLTYLPSHISGLPQMLLTPTGKVTKTKEQILGTSNCLDKVYYYDRLGRVIQTVEYNSESSLYLRISRIFDLHGNALQEKSSTYTVSPSGSLTTVDSLSITTYYDNLDRPTMQYLMLDGDGDAYAPTHYAYEGLGNIVHVNRGDGLYDYYAYNIQGRETDHKFYRYSSGIADTLFVSKIRYYDAFDSGSTPCRNGSISSISSLYGFYARHTINYTYDGMGRLTGANAAAPVYSHWHNNDYVFQDSFAYDKNSNLIYEDYEFNAGGLWFDYYDPVYYYQGNQRNGTTYDGNGNATSISGKVASASYNLLNLPDSITPVVGNPVTFRYSTGGEKLSVAQDSVKYAYTGPFKYKIVNGGAPVLETVTCPGDIRIERDATGAYVRRYYVTDHVGSTRLVTDRQGNILQQSEFTPYGTTIDNALMISGNSHYLWCGKEYQQFIDIPLYDSSARFVTTDGIFTSPDPLCEENYHLSPYTYCGGDPINKVDQSGLLEWPILPSYNGYNTRIHENNYGQNRGTHTHGGVDINYRGAGNKDLGAPVLATHSGRVIRVASYSDGDGGGNRIKISSDNGKVSTYYMHLDSMADLKVGDYVAEGQQIGTMGRSGKGIRDKYDSHLHYEMFVFGERINPALDTNSLVDPQPLTGEPIHLFDTLEPAIITDVMPHVPQEIVKNKVNQ